jgi:2-polyprenyl-3-methyl-5-hydroxy-6-metoxy-1,4-benzoquinol methylase
MDKTRGWTIAAQVTGRIGRFSGVRGGFKTLDHACGQGNISSKLEAISSRLKGKDMIRTASSFKLQAFSRSM